MSNQYVTLNFEFKKYANEDETEQVISFEGVGGWQRMQFHKKPPSEDQMRLLTELARILDEFSRI